mgnify:CR=1 FL=1
MAYTTINDPSAHFQTALWTGNGGTQSIVNDGNSNLKPDFLWTKRRDGGGQNHHAVDSTRGSTETVVPNDTDGESAKATGCTSFDTDGFSVGADNNYNSNSNTFVGWQWKANGGTTSTNNDGSQASTVQANTTAGFSIVKRTGTGSAGATYGHGLGVVPDVIINKGLNTNNWYCYFKAIGGGTKWLMLDGDGAAVTDANMWNNTSATSSVFTVGNSGGSNGSAVDYIAYCFASVKGYSKFGSYTGNGDADGPFIYTGFKPAWLMIKKSSGTNHWHMFDNKRDPDNVVQKHLLADLANDEASNTWGDLLSNGFKLRTTLVGVNGSGDDYVYMAFAQNPFVATNNVVATAR